MTPGRCHEAARRSALSARLFDECRHRLRFPIGAGDQAYRAFESPIAVVGSNEKTVGAPRFERPGACGALPERGAAAAGGGH